MNVKPVYSEETIIGTMMNRMIAYPDRVTIKSRFDKNGRKTEKVHSITWGELKKDIIACGRGLLHLGFNSSDRAAIISPNTPTWVKAMVGTILCRASFIPIYPTSKEEDVWWYLHDSASKVVFCHGKDHLNKCLRVKDRLTNLKYIITMDPDLHSDEEIVMSFKKLLEIGESKSNSDSSIEKLIQDARGDDIAAIMYTSGTTGRPKGVMLTNKNFISQKSITEEFDFKPGDVWLGHLPLSHSLGLSVDLLNSGFQVGTLFIADSLGTKEMRENLLLCRPTVLTTVPMLWEKLYLQIKLFVKTSPAIVQKIFHWSVAAGKEKFNLDMENQPLPLKLWLKTIAAAPVFKVILKKAGLSKLRICISAGGPIHTDLLIFFGAIGIKIYQGYGLTETSPVTHGCTPKNNRIGTVGKPIPGTSHRLGPDGELLIKGPQVMKGYLNNPVATEETFTDDGFFKTGDIARIDEDGYVEIIDRKKELIITKGGKNIAPQPLQDAFNADPFIEHIYVTGDNRKYIAALIVPNFSYLEDFLGENGIVYKNVDETINSKLVRDIYTKRVDIVNKTLARYETIKRFALLKEPFSEEGGELTPTLKIKRKFIEKKYRHIIDKLYPVDRI